MNNDPSITSGATPAAAPPRFTFAQKIAAWLIPPLAAFVIRALDHTFRYEVIVEEGAEPGSLTANQIWCFWHRCLIPTICYFQGRISPGVMVSRSFDGELIARSVARLGFRPVRGSSTRSGASGFLALARMLESGSPAVLTADGPHGPLFTAKPGAIKLAELTGRPIGAFYVFPEKAWRLRSWDSFLLPKPFSRVVICWSRHIAVSRGGDALQLEADRLELERALERTRKLAEQHFA